MEPPTTRVVQIQARAVHLARTAASAPRTALLMAAWFVSEPATSDVLGDLVEFAVVLGELVGFAVLRDSVESAVMEASVGACVRRASREAGASRGLVKSGILVRSTKAAGGGGSEEAAVVKGSVVPWEFS